MPGPAPKDPSVRARRNKSVSAMTLTTPTAGELSPKPPELPEIQQWHVMTLMWWKDLWTSPMATEFLQVDSHALIRLAVLIDNYWRKPSHYLAAEIRQQEQRFGLTPLDRRRLEWQIESAEEAKDRGSQRRERGGVKQPSKRDDPRKLFAV